MPVLAPRSGRALQPAGNCPPATARSGSPFPPSWANAPTVARTANAKTNVRGLCKGLIITEIRLQEVYQPGLRRLVKSRSVVETRRGENWLAAPTKYGRNSRIQ